MEYNEDFLKTSGSLWQCDKHQPNDNLANSESLESKVKIAGNTANNGNTKKVELIVPLKYVSNFWRTLEMPLIHCEVNLILAWSSACVFTNSTSVGRIEKLIQNFLFQ